MGRVVPRMVATLTASLLMLLLSGCISMRYYELGVPLTEADSPNPDDGVNLVTVMQQLGPPQRLSATTNGYVMAWEYWYVTERKVGFSLGAAGADFLSVDWGDANARGDFLLMSFDRDHRLLTSHFEEWDQSAGVGQGVQPFLSAIDVVDVEDLLRPLRQHEWGFNSLGSLPATLNRDNRMDTGQNGIQQRGTTRAVGQESSE
jgi:hypothetical protein